MQVSKIDLVFNEGHLVFALPHFLIMNEDTKEIYAEANQLSIKKRQI